MVVMSCMPAHRHRTRIQLGQRLNHAAPVQVRPALRREAVEHKVPEQLEQVAVAGLGPIRPAGRPLGALVDEAQLDQQPQQPAILSLRRTNSKGRASGNNDNTTEETSD